MTLKNLFLIMSFYSLSVNGQHYEQGVFESDASFTRRVYNNFIPKIKDVYECKFFIIREGEALLEIDNEEELGLILNVDFDSYYANGDIIMKSEIVPNIWTNMKVKIYTEKSRLLLGTFDVFRSTLHEFNGNTFPPVEREIDCRVNANRTVKQMTRANQSENLIAEFFFNSKSVGAIKLKSIKWLYNNYGVYSDGIPPSEFYPILIF